MAPVPATFRRANSNSGRWAYPYPSSTAPTPRRRSVSIPVEVRVGATPRTATRRVQQAIRGRRRARITVGRVRLCQITVDRVQEEASRTTPAIPPPTHTPPPLRTQPRHHIPAHPIRPPAARRSTAPPRQALCPYNYRMPTTRYTGEIRRAGRLRISGASFLIPSFSFFVDLYPSFVESGMVRLSVTLFVFLSVSLPSSFRAPSYSFPFTDNFSV
jgi:hypothetical protein